jgi:hypothetical protein
MSEPYSNLPLLPEGPFRASVLLLIEPPALRQLLRAGLKGGLTDEKLAEYLGFWAETERQKVLEELLSRGWLLRRDDCWHTVGGH